MIRGLPEDSRWVELLAARLEDGILELPEGFDDGASEAAEKAFWTPERRFLAKIHDAIQLNTEATGHWKDGKPPELPRLSPDAPENAKGQAAPARPSEPQPGDPDFMLYHFSRLGMPAGGGRS